MPELKPFNAGPVSNRSMPFWCVANPLGDPFGEPVLSPISSIEVAKLLAEAANDGLIEMTSFHDDDLVSWNPKQPGDDLAPGSRTSQVLSEIKEILRGSGLCVNTATCNLHSNRIFRRGGLTNPDPDIRELAIKKVQRTLRIGHFFDAQYFTYWVARDGFEVPVSVPWRFVYRWIAEGLNGVHDYIKGRNFTNYKGATIEPKPNEPRGHMFLPTAGHAVGFILGALDSSFWGVNPELLQHEGMTLLDALTTVAYLVSLKKLSFLHFGSQIKGQFDNDFPPLIGPEGLKETIYLFWVLEQMGWNGVVEFDCHILRTEANSDDPIGYRRQFIKNCSTALSIILQMIGRIGKETKYPIAETVADLMATSNLFLLNPDTTEKLTRKQ